MFAANSKLDFGASGAAALSADTHQFTDTVLIDRDERIGIEDATPLIGLQKASGGVAAQAAIDKK